MTPKVVDYSLFFRFLDAYSPFGFKGIGLNDHLVLELEALMEVHNQFFYIADAIQLKVLFTSARSLQMIGIAALELSPYHFMEAIHPSDSQRYNLGRAKIIKLAQELFIAEKGSILLATNYKFRTPSGEFSDLLIQGYLFFTTIPKKTVFFLKIHTNIDWHKKIRHGYHYYIGNDISLLRYPDSDMLTQGNIFSDREFEIIKLIESGMSSEKIADKLFLSIHTVNTHRRNILEKSGKESLSELIYDLIEQGLM